jgi:hypothetical protein
VTGLPTATLPGNRPGYSWTFSREPEPGWKVTGRPQGADAFQKQELQTRQKGKVPALVLRSFPASGIVVQLLCPEKKKELHGTSTRMRNGVPVPMTLLL